MTTAAIPVEVVALVVSPVHAYEGRPADGPRPDPGGGARERVEIRAGHGVVGDRYAGHAAHATAAVTVFAADALDAVAAELGLAAVPDPLLPRRNVVLRGVPADVLGALAPPRGTGAVFALDAGSGPVRFRAHRHAAPCRWMDVVLGPGAFRALRGRGGLRCAPLDDGWVRRGPAVLRVLEPPVPAPARPAGRCA